MKAENVFVDFLVKVRDASEEALEQLTPEEIRKDVKPAEAQFNSLNWTEKEGAKGAYQQATNDNSPEFKALSDYLQSHNGFVTLYGWKVWLHQNNPNLIDRRKETENRK